MAKRKQDKSTGYGDVGWEDDDMSLTHRAFERTTGDGRRNMQYHDDMDESSSFMDREYDEYARPLDSLFR